MTDAATEGCDPIPPKPARARSSRKSTLPIDACAKLPASHVPDGFFVMTRGRTKKDVQSRNLTVSVALADASQRVELFAGKQPTTDEQSVLYALLGIASKPIQQDGHSLLVTTSAATARPEHVPMLSAIQPDLFEQRSDAAALALFQGECLIARATVGEIAFEAGFSDSGRDLQRVRDALLNLYTITATEFDGLSVVRQPAHLIGFDKILIQPRQGNESRGAEIAVALNQRLTETILGNESGPTTRYVRVVLSERLKLNSQAAQLLHSSLCRDVWPNRPMVRVDVEALFPRIFAPTEMVQISAKAYAAARNDKERRQRILNTRHVHRETIRKALKQIGGLPDWQVELTKDGRRWFATIARTRPAPSTDPFNLNNCPAKKPLPPTPTPTPALAGLQQTGQIPNEDRVNAKRNPGE